MPIDAAKLNERLDRFVTDPGGTDHETAPNSSQPSPTGTWTIDPADSTVSVAWPKLRLWTITGRLQGMGVIHLDGLPPIGVVRFQQPSGRPVRTSRPRSWPACTTRRSANATGCTRST